MLPNLDGDNKNKGKQPPNMKLPNFDMPAVEDDFAPLPVEEALYNESDEDNEEIYEEANRKVEENVLPTVGQNEEETDKTENDYNPDYEEDLKREEEERNGKFIDKKKKKIIPFGGKKSKKKTLVKSSDFDDRKNKLAKTKVMQFTIMAVIFILFLVGLKNTFLPAHVYTDVQIKQFAAEGAGQTGFPAERGKAFVENFMEVYLAVDRSKTERYDLLGDFYAENNLNNNSGDKLNLESGMETKQKVLIGPTVYDQILVTSYSAQYKVSAFVSSPTGEEVVGEQSAGRWVSFSVNLYYDEATDSLAITKDSPTVIPAYKITNQTVVPPRLPLGNGQVNKDIAPALTPTINGFVEAYAKSSLESHESILQYIDNKNDVNLLSGFGGSVKLKGSPSESIEKVIYNSDDGIYRVDVKVKWVDQASTDNNNRIEYTSRYIMRVVSIGEGKYAVSSFVPYTYYKQ